MTKPTIRAWDCGRPHWCKYHSKFGAWGEGGFSPEERAKVDHPLSRHSDMAEWLRLKAETIRAEESSKYGHTADHQVIANEIRGWADELEGK